MTARPVMRSLTSLATGEAAIVSVNREKHESMAKQVFIVDDEKIIANTLAIILGMAGVQAKAFYNARMR